MHTFIVPFILLELFLSTRNYPSRKLGISVALSYNYAYVLCIHVIYFWTGIWVYPFLNMFSWPMKIMYFGGSSVIGIAVYLLGEKLDGLSALNIRVTYTNGKANVRKLKL